MKSSTAQRLPPLRSILFELAELQVTSKKTTSERTTSAKPEEISENTLRIERSGRKLPVPAGRIGKCSGVLAQELSARTSDAEIHVPENEEHRAKSERQENTSTREQGTWNKIGQDTY